MNNENLIPAKAKDGGWTCDKCGLVFRTRLLLNTHKKEVHKNTKEDDYKKRSASNHQICSCSFCGRKFSTKSGKSIHEKYCADNPNHISCNGHKQSDEVKLKLSFFWKEKHKDYKCAFNEKACEYMDLLNEEKGWNLQHALNGGEISCGPFSLDGYDKNLNIVFEYDEKQHNKSKAKEHDLYRQKFIIDKLNCEFWRYDESKDLLYRVK